ncbi:MAG: type II toxin-antitoxin system Phd/YefM family antitoxin [Candidatus Limnocylindrales bacterium]
MEKVVNIHEAKTNFSRLIERVRAGERVVIAKAGRPVAVLSRYEGRPPRRVPGMDRGRVVIHANFDDPVPEWDPDNMHPDDPLRGLVG